MNGCSNNTALITAWGSLALGCANVLSRRTINGDDVTAGTDPKDCTVKKANNQWYTPREAQASGCLNKDSPDQYGHYREAKYVYIYTTTNPRLLDTSSTFLPLPLSF